MGLDGSGTLAPGPLPSDRGCLASISDPHSFRTDPDPLKKTVDQDPASGTNRIGIHVDPNLVYMGD